YPLRPNITPPNQEHLHYLILSPIPDIHAADREQSSIMRLAEEMNNLGDIQRASEYINLSWNLSQAYRTRMRFLANIGPLSLINNSYQETIKRHNSELRTYITCVAVLAAMLVVALLYTYRLLRANAEARNRLQEANTKLTALNENYESVNRDLHATNIKLSESNLIKEVYVARFFKLCSVYVNRLQKYRKQIHNKLQRGQTAELLKITKPGNDIDNSEVRELYENFDAAFLHIFPNFVEAVNSMLVPEERIELKPGEKLNTELRILALIRLGITDSSQIAELLHYSVNTIYNYRSRVKSKAKANRNDFEEMISKIR
ncbi:MAG: helix-turn-helix transcriptional regulator, partial [Muribaculaceae bacterium]|nr:helix-turn-helix transcriptional regulator [Muribaculaceae bacterium]